MLRISNILTSDVMFYYLILVNYVLSSERQKRDFCLFLFFFGGRGFKFFKLFWMWYFLPNLNICFHSRVMTSQSLRTTIFLNARLVYCGYAWHPILYHLRTFFIFNFVKVVRFFFVMVLDEINWPACIYLLTRPITITSWMSQTP